MKKIVLALLLVSAYGVSKGDFQYNASSACIITFSQGYQREVKISLKDVLEQKFPGVDSPTMERVRSYMPMAIEKVVEQTLEEETAMDEESAFWCLSGARKDLQGAFDCDESETTKRASLLSSGIHTVLDVKEAGFESVLGYRYCVAFTCISLWKWLKPADRKALFKGINIPEDIEAYGRALMQEAAKSKEEGGDDDSGACEYIQSHPQLFTT